MTLLYLQPEDEDRRTIAPRCLTACLIYMDITPSRYKSPVLGKIDFLHLAQRRIQIGAVELNLRSYDNSYSPI